MSTSNCGLVNFNRVIQAPNTQSYLRTVLGDRAETFVTSLTSLMANSQQLQKCDTLTVMYAAMKATALGLPFDSNLGMAYCIPYENKRKGICEAQFQLGYKGLIQLALRSGQLLGLNVTEVRNGELTNYNLLTGEFTLKAATVRLSLPIVGYAAYIHLVSGFEKSIFWTKEECEKHALRYSQTYSSKYEITRNSSKWTTDFDAMAKKTVLKQLLSKYAPLSAEMQNAIKADQAIIHVDEKGFESLDYVDNDIEQRNATTLEESKEQADAIRMKAEAAMNKVNELQKKSHEKEEHN